MSLNKLFCHIWLLCFSCFTLVSCAKTSTHNFKVITVAKNDKQSLLKNHVERGIATYYSKGINGHLTASGERLDNSQLVAAHKTLPFGSYVKVTALWNGKSVVVKIIDRGPYVKGRIIDLSQAAASHLGLIGKGIGKVEIELVNKPLK